MTIHFEQAVYGSFAFWDRGYGVLTHTEGCRPEWLAELRHVCQRYGEPTLGALEPGGFFALPLRSGPWLVARASSQGCDDRGRPGALAFHALFISRWAYRWAGGNPFVFAQEIRNDWKVEDQNQPLPRGQLSGSFFNWRPRQLPHVSAPAESIATALIEGRRVVVQSMAPIDALARDVWSRLPGRVRLRSSVATLAFDNANDFNLIALPRLNGIVLDTRDMMLALEPAGRD
jgi:hypothetical protein